MTRIRTVAVLPTLFTLANLVCGFFAIVVAARVDAPTSIDVPNAAPWACAAPSGPCRHLGRTIRRTT